MLQTLIDTHFTLCIFSAVKMKVCTAYVLVSPLDDQCFMSDHLKKKVVLENVSIEIFLNAIFCLYFKKSYLGMISRHLTELGPYLFINIMKCSAFIV